jgi:hypothetical protein
VKLGRVAIDGTEIKANASKHEAISCGRRKQAEAALGQEVAELLRRAAAADRDEDQQYAPDPRASPDGPYLSSPGLGLQEVIARRHSAPRRWLLGHCDRAHFVKRHRDGDPRPGPPVSID